MRKYYSVKPKSKQQSLSGVQAALRDLELYGRTFTNGKVSRRLAHKLRLPKEHDLIDFYWNKSRGRSIITLAPGIKLYRESKHRVKIYKGD